MKLTCHHTEAVIVKEKEYYNKLVCPECHTTIRRLKFGTKVKLGLIIFIALIVIF